MNILYYYSIIAIGVLGILIGTIIYIFMIPSKEQRYKRQLEKCYHDLYKLIDKNNCAPIMLRLAWSDAVTYDCMIKEWPYCGGVNGSIRFDRELNHHSNTGLSKAIGFLEPLHYKYYEISWADLIQMAGIISIRVSGGPLISIQYGRIDASREIVNDPLSTEELLQQAKNTKERQFACSIAATHIRNLEYPSAVPPYPDGALSADVHLRNIFYRLGLNNRDTVALCGAHTIGRAFADRSGVCLNFSGNQGATIYTRPSSIARSNGQVGNIGMAGGCSWTTNWLTFDNSYYKRILKENGKDLRHDPQADQLLWLPTDQALYDSPEYRPYFITYANNIDVFYQDYTNAHIKMSELGAKFKYHIYINTK